jgi:hypothetical protein
MKPRRAVVTPGCWPTNLPMDLFTPFARYRRATALHEGGHAVVAEILFPHLVKEVQIGSVSPLSDTLQEIVRETKAGFADGQVVYEIMLVDDADDASDKLLKRIVVVSAGIEFQSMEGFEAPDLEVTVEAEGLLIQATLKQWEKEFNVLPDAQLQILDKVEGLVADLRRDGGVRKAVTQVAEKLMISSAISGSCVRQIVEINCASALLARMRARL